MFKEINEYINHCVRLSDNELETFNKYLKPKHVPKKTFLLREGEICNFEAFIIKGCIKTYFIDDNGFETILTFATENWWVSDISSFSEQKPSRMFIETLEDCDLLIINANVKEELLQKVPLLERAFRLMLQRHLAVYQERLFGYVALSAQERYEIFLEKYPKIPQRVPQHLIASYLGISPEFLSRIRKRSLKR